MTLAQAVGNTLQPFVLLRRKEKYMCPIFGIRHSALAVHLEHFNSACILDFRFNAVLLVSEDRPTYPIHGQPRPTQVV